MNIEMKWKKINTAPVGIPFMAWIRGRGLELECRINQQTGRFEIRGSVGFEADDWDTYDHMVPTHWMPYPSEPNNGL